ncbi:hypothetical protein MKEN_01083900 [Mycena kentingensis (nom. inval.)]|nr:hypothetical protein MKEN_01083900 [Mycena kentingensis (nom. inval.)]
MSSYSAYATLPVPTIPGLKASSFLQRKLGAYAKHIVAGALNRILIHGILELVDTDGSVRTFGEQTATEPNARRATIHIRDERFWLRVYRSYDVGFSEAYMAGECDSPDLKSVLELFVDNMQYIDRGVSTLSHRVFKAFSIASHFLSHGHAKSIGNVAMYDASNELYTVVFWSNMTSLANRLQAFLSKEMQYSCPIWSTNEGGVRGDLEGHRAPCDLEAAQFNKIDYILRKARLKSGGRLLEIGSGWGSIAIAAAKMGCTVDTITLSIEQKTLAEKRIRDAGFADKIRVHFMDYRDMPPEFENAFDACVSLEMLEAVGIEYMPTYISKIDWALKDKDSAVVLTATTYPEHRFTRYQGQNFIRKYHWPHTVLFSALSLSEAFHKTLGGKFSVDSIEDFGTHYPRCLREWGRRLEQNWNQELIESLQDRFPELKDPYFLEMFRRKWHYMFLYMEVAYSRVWLSCFCWTFARPGYAATASA